jgi:obg-like ATPase 1
MPKKNTTAVEKPFLGRPGNHVKMGIVGLPNIGKSSTFNLMCGMEVPAENFPFCTIDPSVSRVAYPDARFDWLCELFNPVSKVPAFLTVTDIAGLIKGASEGEGLGNAFLSNILACDGIFHIVRAFSDEEIVHVDGDVDPVRDLQTIRNELLIKDLEFVHNNFSKVEAEHKRNAKDKEAKENYLAFCKIKEWIEDGKELRFGDWTGREIDMINSAQYLTAKPVVFLVNLSEKAYCQKKNKFLQPLMEWIQENSGGEPVIPFSVAFEANLAKCETDEEKAAYIQDKKEKYKVEKLKSAMDRIVVAGYRCLHLHHFFTCGPDEVKCWTIRERTKAPQAAGTIHGDFETHFIKAEVMAYEDLRAAGSEAECKGAGKMQLKGKEYVVQDGDCIFFHHNATK